MTARDSSFALWFLAAFLLAIGLLVLYVAVFLAGPRQAFPFWAGGGLGLFLTVCGLGALRLAFGARWGRRPEPRAPGALPRGLEVEYRDGSTVWRWRLLPRSLFWVFFWGFLTLFVGGLAVASFAGMATEMSRRSPGLVFVFLVFAAVAVGLMAYVGRLFERQGRVWAGGAIAAVVLANFLIGVEPFIFFGAAGAALGYVAALCGYILLGRCRLRIDADGLAYEERVLDIPLRWRWRTLGRGEIADLRTTSPRRGTGALEVVGRDGGKFTLMLPRGPGAISPAEIERLRNRWRRELGLRPPG